MRLQASIRALMAAAALLALFIPASSAAVCGNGSVEAGETCDDGNVTSGDGCSSTCQFEGCPYTGVWSTTITGTTYLGNTREDAFGSITGTTYTAGNPSSAIAIASATRVGATVTATYV